MTFTPEQVQSEKLGKLYRHYLIPTMLSTLMGSVYGMADLIFVGNGVGKDALAAISIATPMYNLFSCLVFLFGIGAATAMAVCSGEDDQDGANQYFTLSMIMLVAVSLVVTLGFQLFLDPIARFLGATDLLLPLVRDYMGIVTLATPGFLVSWCIGSFIRNDGNPGLVMWSSIIPNIFNVLMDYIFVFPMQMGIKGAALATALSPVLGLVISMFHFLCRKNKLRLVRPRFRWTYIGRMLKNGSSYCVQEVSGGVMIFTYNALLLALGGETAVSVYAVVMNVGWTAMALCSGFIGAAQPIISINVGGGKYDRARKAFRYALISGGVFCLLSTAALLVYPSEVCGLFSAGDPTLHHPSAEAGRLYFWMLIPAALNIIMLGMVQACEWVKQALYISLSRSLVLLMTSVLVLSWLLGLPGTWFAATVSEALTAVLSVLIYRSLSRDFRARAQLDSLAASVRRDV